MMPLLWIMLWSLFPPPAHFSSPDHCTVHESSPNESSLLQSLQCYNDYMSLVHCKWSEHRSTTTQQLWFTYTIRPGELGGPREQCVPYDVAAQDATEHHRTVHCRYNTREFSMGTRHNLFFLKNNTESLCSSVRHTPLDLSQHLRARHPVNLSTHDAGDGGRLLSWSSPYPSSSSLNENITYQLSYRTDRQDIWTMENVTNTSVKLEKQSLVPGRRYEARVRARVSVGQWSHWSPAVTWQTEEGVGQPPSLHCVLEGENEVMCSWKVSRELAHFITYQLACQRNQTAPSERCCELPTVTPDLSGSMLKYSCLLTDAADPAHLLLELIPTRSAKIFRVNHNIRPNPPQQVKVWEKDDTWIVEWTELNNHPDIRLSYELCYKRTQDQECTILPVPKGSTSQTFLETFLDPTQEYQVKVRSLVAHEDYKGVPSKWTEPVKWTSHEATRSLSTLIYFSIGALVAVIFLALYCTIPACQRRVVLWVDSVPSPAKSKILSEFKSAASWTLMQSESTAMCKVQHMDSVSTCSSEVSLWSTKDSQRKCLEKDEDCWKCDNLPSPTEDVHTVDTSSMSFSGPYIFCQVSEPSCTSMDVKCEEEKKETSSDDSASSSPVTFTIYGQGYVCLPSRGVFKSTQDLVSHCDADTNTHRQDGAEQDQQHPDKSDVQQGLDWTASKPTGIHQPPAYITGPFTSWPQGGTVQSSGYCHIPTSTHPT